MPFKMEVIAYNNEIFERFEVNEIEKVEGIFEKIKNFKNKLNLWINIDGVNKTLFKKISEFFNLNPIIKRFIFEKHPRSFLEKFDNYFFLSTKMLHYSQKSGRLITEHINFIVSKDFVITFQNKPFGDIFEEVRKRLKNKDSVLRKEKANYLFCILMDSIIKGYSEFMEKTSEEIEKIETNLIQNPSSEKLKKIHSLRRKIINFKKAIYPLKEIFRLMEEEEIHFFDKNSKRFLRALWGDIIHIIDNSEILREILTENLSIYLSSVSNKLNQIMKILTIISTIFIPMTFITGIYGMNFKYMPELQWKYGYLFAWIVMLSLGISMLLYFKKKKWL